jgi:hypothetical protein
MSASASIQPFPEQRAEEVEEVIGFYERAAMLGAWVPYVPPVGLVSIVGARVTIPDRILVGSLNDGRLRVHTPIAVKFSTEEEHVIAEAEEFNEFGFGTNLSEALRDLQRALAELYFTLEQERHRLGPDIERVWARLRQAISRRP